MAFGVGMGAVSLGTVFVAINANLTGLVSGTQLAKAHLGHFQRQVAEVSPQLQRMGMAATIAGAAITAMAAMSVRQFAQFEQEMANVGSVLGEHFRDMTSMREIARDWGQTTIFSARETAQAMYYLASAGYNAEQTVEALGATLTLAGATMNDLGQTTQMVVAAMNAFAMGTENADRVANAYAAAISKSQATAERLAISMRYVAPIAHNAGQEFETVVAALGLLYNSGMEASMAGTALRMSLVRLARLTPMARREIENLGIAAKDVDPTLNSLVDIVRQFEEHKITPRAASVIFGARALAGILNLVTAGSARLEEMEMSISGTNKAYEMLDIQTDTFIGTLKKLRNSINEIVLQFGQALVPVLRKVADGLRETALFLGDLPEWMQRVAAFSTTAAGGLTLLTGVLGFMVSLLPRIAVGLSMVKNVLLGLAGPVGWIVAALGALVAAFVGVGAAARKMEELSIQGQVERSAEIKKTIDAMGSEIESLDKLTTKLDELNGITAKSNAETAELQRVMNMLGNALPQVVTGFDDLGNVIGINRDALEEYRTTLVANHQMMLKLNQDRWQAQLEIAQMDLEMVKKRFATENEGFAELSAKWEGYKKARLEALSAGEGGAGGISISEYLGTEKEYNEQLARINEIDAEMRELIMTIATLKGWLTDLGGGEDTNYGLSEEEIDAIVKLQTEAAERLKAITLDNIENEFDRRREAAQRQYDEDIALADGLAGYQENLREQVADIEASMAKETDVQKIAEAEATRDILLTLIEDLASQESDLRLAAEKALQLAKAQIQKDADEETLRNRKQFLDRLKQLRIAAEEGQYAEARARAHAQYAEDMDLAKEAGEHRNEIETLAAIVLKQALVAIRRSELEEELQAERNKNRMSLTEYRDYIQARLAATAEGNEDYLALQAELVEVEQEIAEQRRQSWERWSSNIANSLSNATVNWLNALRRDSKEAEQIWTDLGQTIKDAIIKKALDPVAEAVVNAVAIMLEEVGKLIWRLLFAKALAWMLNLLPGLGDAAGAASSSTSSGAASTAFSTQDPVSGNTPFVGKVGGKNVRDGFAYIHHDERLLSPKLTDLVESMAEMPFPGAGMGQATIPETRPAQAPWESMGMDREDFLSIIAGSTPDQIIVAPGGMLSIDEDSVDDFYEKVMLPAKRRMIQRLRNATGEAID